MQIEIENLFFSYDGAPLLERVHLQVRKGEFIGIMGPNGGGKTTLLRLLMGFLTPNRGRVSVQGRVGYVPQVHRTDRDFPITVQELVLLGALSQCGFWGYPKGVLARAEALMEQLGLRDYRSKPFSSLSGGLAQRALLARALLGDPDLLLLDEATANIDLPSTKIIFELLRSLRGKKTILLVTHDLRAIIEWVDRVLCVQGEVSSFLPKEVCEHFALGLYHTPLLRLRSEKKREPAHV